MMPTLGEFEPCSEAYWAKDIPHKYQSFAFNCTKPTLQPRAILLEEGYRSKDNTQPAEAALIIQKEKEE
jgi:hypothetical protein